MKSLHSALLIVLLCSGSAVAQTPNTPASLLAAWRTRGIDLTGSYTAEWLSNPIGGLRPGSVYAGLAELTLHLDLERLVRWPGAALHASLLAPHGDSLSERSVGDLGVLSNIDFTDSLRLYELWLEQTWSWANTDLSLRAGLLAADEEFLTIDSADLFLHSAFGPPIAISGNMPIPAYAISALGVHLKASFASGAFVRLGLYDGNPAPAALPDPSPNAALSTEYNHHGLHWSLREAEGLFILLEAGWENHQPASASSTLAERLLLGAAWHTDDFASQHQLQDNRSTSHRGNYALYTIAEAEVHKDLTLFTRLVWAPPDRNFFTLSAEAGLRCDGPLPSRPDDSCGLAASLYKIGQPARRTAERAGEPTLDYEAVIEATYRIQLTPAFSLQPSCQWIIHPGGGPRTDNALVLALRSEFTF